MRIAYFTDTYLPQINGVTNTLEKLERYLQKTNNEYMFFTPRYPGSESVSISNITRFNSISLPFYPECRLSIPFYKNLSSIADSFKPDIVHLVTEIGIGLVGLRYARERQLPIVSSFHTNFDAYLKYYRLEYLEPFAWTYFKWFHNFSLVNFCPSMETMKTLDEKGINNLRIWSRGVDTEIFSPKHVEKNLTRKYRKKNRMVFLYVGRVAAEKDLDTLLGSINSINSLYPGKSSFVIVGDGPYKNEMKKKSPDNVYFTGYLKGKKLSAIYASCDVFVFPSGTETFGNVVLEAMASGLPVIAANSGGVKDSVMNGYNGILCNPKDTASFTQAIESFICNDEQVQYMSKNALNYASSKSWDSVFSKLVSDYTETCKDFKNGLIKSA